MNKKIELQNLPRDRSGGSVLSNHVPTSKQISSLIVNPTLFATVQSDKQTNVTPS